MPVVWNCWVKQSKRRSRLLTGVFCAISGIRNWLTLWRFVWMLSLIYDTFFSANPVIHFSSRQTMEHGRKNPTLQTNPITQTKFCWHRCRIALGGKEGTTLRLFIPSIVTHPFILKDGLSQNLTTHSLYMLIRNSIQLPQASLATSLSLIPNAQYLTWMISINRGPCHMTVHHWLRF
jgi:hypothetical protein